MRAVADDQLGDAIGEAASNTVNADELLDNRRLGVRFQHHQRAFAEPFSCGCVRDFADQHANDVRIALRIPRTGAVAGGRQAQLRDAVRR